MSWLLKALGALVLVILLVMGLIWMIPSERIADLASTKFKELTGRDLVIKGEVTPRFFPVLGISTGAVEISNAEWSESGLPMISADRLVIAINAASLFGGALEILGLQADQPVLNLERAKDGRENWVFGGGGAAGEISSETAAVGRAWSLADGSIRNGVIRYTDHQSGQKLQLDAVNLTLKVPDYRGAFEVSLQGLHRGQTISLNMNGAAFSTFEAGREVPLQVQAKIGGSSLEFEGRGGWRPLAAEGVLKGNLADVSALAALAGAQNMSLPEGLGARKLLVSGSFNLREGGRMALSNAKIEADQNILQGDLAFEPGKDRPFLRANLAAAALTFKSPSSAGEPGPKVSHPATGWSKDRFDLSALAAFDAEASLAAESLEMDLLKIGRTRMGVKLDRSRVVFDLREMAAYGGAVAGEFVLNGRGSVSVGGKLTLANLQAQGLLSDLLGWERLVAQGNLSLNFLGVGNSLDAILKSLSGEGSFSLGKGELRGLDIVGMIRNLDTSYVGEGQRTIFDGIGGTFTINEGNLRNSDLRFVAPYLSATGEGRIGIGARDLDYAIRPTAFSGPDGTGGVMVPLRVTGSWADPTYRLDLEEAARQRMENEAKAALENKLGLSTPQGERLEDTLKRGAEEALKKEAGKLLQGLFGN